MPESTKAKFEQRFDDVVRQMRTTRVLTVLGWASVALTATVVVLAGFDYFLETSWTFRATTVAAAVCAALLASIVCVGKALHRWNRRSTAAKVEQRFEDLGQSVRTAVQFRDAGSSSSGVSQNLVNALHRDVAAKTDDLRLREAIATHPLKVAIATLALFLLSGVVAVSTSWDWRMAISRALLGNTPYTTVGVEQGSQTIDEKETFTLDTHVAGRIDRKIELMTRIIDDEEASEWDTRPLTSSDETHKETRLVSYSIDIPKVRKPFEYRVVAGKYTSPLHRVDVRYPLAIEAFHIELTPPEYTGLGTKHISRGNFETVEGSQIVVGVELDNEPARAWLELRPVYTALGEEPVIERVNLQIDGTRLTAELDLDDDRFYEVHAEANDGTTIRPNRFRIRIHEDRAPRLRFETPDQLTEVHPLAELMMRLRVSDDYGLVRAGIVFQRNNEAEIPLEEIEFDLIELQDGRLSPQTQAKIESLFPLEYFGLTVNDSISFYGFAEDNRPGLANRNETDLHFIDVRPFRRLYQQPDENGLSGMGNNNNNPNRRTLPALNDMIARERYVLNRTMQLKRQDERGMPLNANTMDDLVNIQNEGSDLTFEMAQVAEEIELQFGIPDNGRISELLFQARQSMLDSIDSLANAEFEVAKLQEKDALQRLINARQRLDDPVQRARNGGGGAAALRRAFRNMRRRQPRNNQERAREVVRRLRQAAAQQEFLMDKMTDLVPPEMPELEEEASEDDAPAEQMENSPEEPRDEELEDDTQDDLTDSMDDEESPESETKNEMDQQEDLDQLRREIEQQQDELSDEIQDVVDMIEQLQQLSNLAGQRTSRAMDGIMGVTGALERGNTRSALNTARTATADLRILADNIAGITADEATNRIAIARDLGMLLTADIDAMEARIGRAAKQLEDTALDGDALAELEDNFTTDLRQDADRQAEIAKTIQDILDSILDPEQGIQDPEDRMVKRLQEIIEENELVNAIARMQQVSSIIDAMDWPSAMAQTGDLADRFEIVSQRLDAMHREIMSPRLEQLRLLEKRAVQAQNSLNELQTNDQVSRWHLRADGLMHDVETAKVAEQQIESMRSTMSDGGWGTSSEWDWETDPSGTAMLPPTEYADGMAGVVSEIQRHIREMSLIDTEVTNTGAIPPRYRQFVDRYMEVLSGAAGDTSTEESVE